MCVCMVRAVLCSGRRGGREISYYLFVHLIWSPYSYCVVCGCIFVIRCNMSNLRIGWISVAVSIESPPAATALLFYRSGGDNIAIGYSSGLFLCDARFIYWWFIGTSLFFSLGKYAGASARLFMGYLFYLFYLI